MGEHRRTFDPSITVAGWWIRFIWGVTFKSDRLRRRRFYGYRLLAVRLWGDPNTREMARLIGIQWRPVDDD
jgi:hypothetical protein